MYKTMYVTFQYVHYAVNMNSTKKRTFLHGLKLKRILMQKDLQDLEK